MERALWTTGDQNARWWLKVIVIALAGLLCAKVLWNLWLPYSAIIARLRQKRAGRPVSLFVELDIGLWITLVVISALARCPVWPHKTALVAVYGAGVIAFSYAHMVALSALSRWVMRTFSRT